MKRSRYVTLSAVLCVLAAHAASWEVASGQAASREVASRGAANREAASDDVTRGQHPGHLPVLAVRTIYDAGGRYSCTVADSITDLLTTELVKTGRYRVVEREGLDQLIDEIDMSSSGYAEPGSVPRRGHFADLEYLFIVKITNLGENVRNATVPLPLFGGVGRQTDEAWVRLDFRIVDATTGEIVFAGYGEGSDKSSGATFFGYSQAGSVNVSNSSFLRSRLGRAALKATRVAIEGMDHDLLAVRASGAALLKARAEADRQARGIPAGQILALAGSESVVVSLGSMHGVRSGDTLTVYRKTNITDSKGTVVFSEERPVGTLTVTEAQIDRSIAKIASGGGLEEGYVVRR